jgi:hypothetical protein
VKNTPTPLASIQRGAAPGSTSRLIRSKTAFPTAAFSFDKDSSNKKHFFSMFAPFVGLVGCTSILQRKRADAHPQKVERSKQCGVDVFHATNRPFFVHF